MLSSLYVDPKGRVSGMTAPGSVTRSCQKMLDPDKDNNKLECCVASSHGRGGEDEGSAEAIGSWPDPVKSPVPSPQFPRSLIQRPHVNQHLPFAVIPTRQALLDINPAIGNKLPIGPSPRATAPPLILRSKWLPVGSLATRKSPKPVQRKVKSRSSRFRRRSLEESLQWGVGAAPIGPGLFWAAAHFPGR